MGIIKGMSEIEKNNNEQASFDPAPDTAFIREQIKQKPINKKKLLRRTLTTALTAVIFGGVACVTLLVLEPFLSKRINPIPETVEQEIATVSFPETSDEEEMLPEDMYANDTEMIEKVLQQNIPDVSQDIQDIEDKISNIEFGLTEYQELYSQLRALSEVVSRSMVVVTGIHSEKDFLDNTYEDNNQVSGIIIADNGISLLVLAKDNNLTAAESILISFWDGTERECSLVGKDEDTQFLVLSVSKSVLPTSTLEYATPITLGSSKSAYFKGTPIIAMGSVSGVTGSVAYGMVTTSARSIYMTDAEYSAISTDIVGTSNASGILINLRGNLVGMIDNSVGNTEDDVLLSAYGITDLKPLIERLSNSDTMAYLGVTGKDISEKMREAYELPDGVFLQSVKMDSPAMAAGLKSGDILVSVNGVHFSNFHELVNWLKTATPGDTVYCEIARQSVDTYTQMDVEVVLGELKYKNEEEPED